MKKWLSYLFISLFLLPGAKAQPLPTVETRPGIPGFMVDLKGEVLVNKYSKVTEGSPFFSDDWLKGKFIGTDGKLYDNLAIKLDLVENDIYFLNDQAKEMILKTPVNYLHLSNPMTGQSFSFIKTDLLCQSNPKTWFQVLDTGKAWLLKSEPKQVSELTTYASAVKEEKIISGVYYYILFKQECFPIKSAQELWEKLNNQKPGFAEKTTAKGPAKKSEEELIRLTRRFNEKPL
jgi:hypothetical protein